MADALTAASATTEEEAQAYCTPRLCHRMKKLTAVAPLPKLHGKATLVTTKLCQQIYKSTAGHVFDLSSPKEHTTLMAYNSLHDHHLKSYLLRAGIKTKLIKEGYVTKELDVICSLREYNSYRHFLENELMKVHKREEEDRNHQQKPSLKIKEDPFKKEREEKRRKFLEDQERQLYIKQRKLRKLEKEEAMAKFRAMEQRRLAKEKNEMKREAEREQRRVLRIQQEHMDIARKQKLQHKCESEEYNRMIHLHKLKQEEWSKHLHELEQRWLKYENHAQIVQEQEEKRKQLLEEEKQKKIRRREKIFKILQERENSRKERILEENHVQIELLKEEADKYEVHLKQVHETEVLQCREKLKKLYHEPKEKAIHQPSSVFREKVNTRKSTYSQMLAPSMKVVRKRSSTFPTPSLISIDPPTPRKPNNQESTCSDEEEKIISSPRQPSTSEMSSSSPSTQEQLTTDKELPCAAVDDITTAIQPEVPSEANAINIESQESDSL